MQRIFTGTDPMCSRAAYAAPRTHDAEAWPALKPQAAAFHFHNCNTGALLPYLHVFKF